MKPLKSVVITFRTDEETKKAIDQMAREREWSVAQVIDKICKQYFQSNTTTTQEVEE